MSSTDLKPDNYRQSYHERKRRIRPVITADCGRFTGLFETQVGFLDSAIIVEYLWSAKVVLILLIVPKGGCQRLHHSTIERGNNEECKHCMLATHISYQTQ